MGPRISLSHSAIDSTQEQPFLRNMALGLQGEQTGQWGWAKVPNIPISCLSLEHAPLATNAVAKVYKGLLAGSPCACKSIRMEEITQEEIRFICRELRISTMLLHDNIVKSHGFGISPPHVRWLCMYAHGMQVLICMELCSSSLYDLLYESNKPINQHQAKSLVLDTAHGVAHIHRIGVLHRDLKSASSDSAC